MSHEAIIPPTILEVCITECPGTAIAQFNRDQIEGYENRLDVVSSGSPLAPQTQQILDRANNEQVRFNSAVDAVNETSCSSRWRCLRVGAVMQLVNEGI